MAGKSNKLGHKFREVTMREPVFRTDDEWRTGLIIEVMVLRTAIFELGILIAIIAVGAFSARWWQDAPVTGAVIALIGTISFYRFSAKDCRRLTDIHFAAEKD
jgi:hypothetical protein